MDQTVSAQRTYFPSPERRQRLERLKDTLIAHLEDATDALHRQLAPLDAPDDPLRTALMRETADILGFWDRCGSFACWRARRCRRSPKNCFADCAQLVPPAARAEAMVKLRERVMARLRRSFSLSPRAGRGRCA